MTRVFPTTLVIAIVAFLPPVLGQETTTTMKDGTLGVGLVVGSPTGLTAKWMAGKDIAFDAAIGVGFGEDLHIHSDWIYEGPAILQEEGATLSWFVGVGGRFEWDDDDDHRDNGNGNGNDDDDDIDLGPRVPAGLELRFASVKPLEIFGEVALGIEIIDDTGLTFDGGIGARWFF